jgi:peptidoglycan/LPS O-acetylase OafA/YrhL
MKYRAEIDGLRALAVIPVILFHAGLEVFSGGFVGVDVFFVISGYLITTILVDDLENNRFSIVKFYERRARRILPALFFVMISCIPFAWMWMVPSQMKDFSQSLISVSLFASNIQFWLESGYFSEVAEGKPLLHTWSLAVEEQYYVIFPVFLLIAWGFGRNRVFWMIVVFAAISLVLSEWGWRHHPTANFYLAPTRAWELLAGSIAAFLVLKRGVRSNELLSLLGLVGIVFSIFVYDESTPFPSVYALVPVVGVVLLILFADEKTVVAKFLSTKLFVGLGLISYSAYLWHQPLFAFARIKSLEAPSLAVMLFLSLASLGLAFLSWRFIETPFRNKVVITRMKIFLLTPLFLILPISLGLVGHFKNGFYEELLTNEQKILMQSAVPSPKRTECHTGGINYVKYDSACTYFLGDLKVAVFGDSHTVELAYALAKELEPYNVKLKHLSFSDCIPSYGISPDTSKGCTEWTDETVQRLLSDQRISTVVISYRINSALFGDHANRYPQLPNQRSVKDIDEIWGAYISMLNTLLDGGKNVILVLQAPELPKPIESLIEHRYTNDFIIGVPKNWWLKRNEFVRTRRFELPEGIVMIDPSDLLCDRVNCFAAANGVAFYFDDDHLSVEGAKLVAKEVIKVIRPRVTSLIPSQLELGEYRIE